MSLRSLRLIALIDTEIAENTQARREINSFLRSRVARSTRLSFKLIKAHAVSGRESGRKPETLGNRRLRLHTSQTIDELAVFKDEHGGYARDLKT